MSAPQVSIILCTRNRATGLAQCLGKLDQDAILRHGGELLIVDNGSSDRTPEIIAGFGQTARIPVRAIAEIRLGLSRARNAGLALCAGRIIVFLDDDVYLADGYLDAVMRTLPTSEFAFAGGRITNFDPTESLYGTNRQETFEFIPARSFLRTGRFQGTNLVMRREVYEKIGGFDTTFGPGTPFRGDDIDYCARASQAGFASAHLPELLVYHHHGRKPGQQRDALARSNAIAGGAYYMSFILRGACWRYLHGWFGTVQLRQWRRFLWEVYGACLYCRQRLSAGRIRPSADAPQAALAR